MNTVLPVGDLGFLCALEPSKSLTVLPSKKEKLCLSLLSLVLCGLVNRLFFILRIHG